MLGHTFSKFLKKGQLSKRVLGPKNLKRDLSRQGAPLQKTLLYYPIPRTKLSEFYGGPTYSLGSPAFDAILLGGLKGLISIAILQMDSRLAHCLVPVCNSDAKV